MRETAKRLAVMSGMLSLMLISTVPALAQEAEGAQYEAEPVAREVSATFELVVKGEPPADAAFFGYLGNGEPFPVALADPDGDGVYVGGYEHVGMGDSLGASIVQSTGSNEDLAVGASPGWPTSTIRDFGLVTFDGDETLSASVSFADEDDEPTASVKPVADPAEPADPAYVEDEASPAPVFVDGAGDDATENAHEAMDALKTSDEERVLPNTGGAALGAISAAALLMAAGLLLRRVTR